MALQGITPAMFVSHHRPNWVNNIEQIDIQNQDTRTNGYGSRTKPHCGHNLGCSEVTFSGHRPLE